MSLPAQPQFSETLMRGAGALLPTRKSMGAQNLVAVIVAEMPW